MLNFPMKFKVGAQSKSGISTTWISGANSREVILAVPPEFSGPGGGFSPEDLYAMALLNCFIATFKVVAEKSKFRFGSLSASADLVVDRDEAGRPWMAELHCLVQLEGHEDAERGLKLLQKTSEQCMILNSTKTKKTFDFRV